jgi:hypothetical protein
MSELLAVNEQRHRTVVVVDIVRFTDPVRTELHRRVVQAGMYDVLETAFDEAGIRWKECETEDRGDGALILVPPQFPNTRLVDQLPTRLLAGLRRYNAAHAVEARMQLRLAVNSGEVHRSTNSFVSQAIDLTFRLIDAAPVKAALERSGGLLALIASDVFYQSVIRHDPATEPGSYRRLEVEVKQTRAIAWLRLPDMNGYADQPVPVRHVLFELVDALLTVPTVSDNAGRQQLISSLRPEIATAVPYHPAARPHVVALVQTCLRHDGGLIELIDAVRGFDGPSIPVRRLEEIARNRQIEG